MHFKSVCFPGTVTLDYTMNYKQNKFYANHSVEYFRIITRVQNLKNSIVY